MCGETIAADCRGSLTGMKSISVSGDGFNEIHILCDAPAFFSDLEHGIFHCMSVPAGWLMPYRLIDLLLGIGDIRIGIQHVQDIKLLG